MLTAPTAAGFEPATSPPNGGSAKLSYAACAVNSTLGSQPERARLVAGDEAKGGNRTRVSTSATWRTPIVLPAQGIASRGLCTPLLNAQAPRPRKDGWEA